MIQRHDLRRVSSFVWEIPSAAQVDMRVSARVVASQELIAEALDDLGLAQLIDAASLPGVVGWTVALPNCHQSYGFPVGGVVATRLPDGVIAPGAIGYGINCGVRLLASELEDAALEPFLDDLATRLCQTCAGGSGGGGRFLLNNHALDAVLREGARWCLRHGLADERDLTYTEERGWMAGADPARISARARERARNQLGTLGEGDHFLEVGRVAAVYDAACAAAFGLWPGQVVVLIHSGSRGLGHQVCTDYLHDFQRVVRRYGIFPPNRETVSAPLDTPEGQAYLAAMHGAANFAFANRQTLAALVRESFTRTLAGSGLPSELRQVYDLSHNIGAIEQHVVAGEPVTAFVHRKGATRACGPGSATLPADYRAVGQPVLTPGAMGRASYVLAAMSNAMDITFGSACHGAGRLHNMEAAQRRNGSVMEICAELQALGVRVRAANLPRLAEVVLRSYKPVETVVDVMVGAGLARSVARLEPLLVVKG